MLCEWKTTKNGWNTVWIDHLKSDDSLNIDLLQKNIEKFGTIFNTVKACCTVNGTVKKNI
jgi:hypothetical protein